VTVLLVILLSKKKEANQSKSDEETTVVTPDICIDHDDKAYYIEVELPGVRKENVDLSVGEQSFCIEAARDEDLVYLGCFSLAHAVSEDKVTAKFQNGLLRVEVPLKAPIKGKRIQIE
jgi:HSP20 family protein